MNKLVKFLKNEVSGWKKWEVVWLIFANVAIFAISIYLGDTAIGILASVTGVACVILCGKGKLSTYIFGIVNTILYALVAWEAKYYGDVLLNLLYYFPTNIIGWFVWKKNMDSDSNEVYKQKMSVKMEIVVGLLSVIGIFGLSFVLNLMGGSLPLVDSMTTVLSIVAQILMIKRYMEQWIIWIIVDTISVAMWIVAFFNGGGSIAVLIMWIVFLANGIIMFVKWYKESKSSLIKEHAQ